MKETKHSPFVIQPGADGFSRTLRDIDPGKHELWVGEVSVQYAGLLASAPSLLAENAKMKAFIESMLEDLGNRADGLDECLALLHSIEDKARIALAEGGAK